MVSKHKLLREASDNFAQSKYEAALRTYAIILKDYPHSKEAYNCAILADMAIGGDRSAEALFDYYLVLREEDTEEADNIMSEILSNMEDSIANSFEALNELLKDPLEERLLYENGISYHDFKKILETSGDFKIIFENIMFSTRVIISEKEDFIDFLQLLLENDYKDVALNYLESATQLYPNEEALQKLVQKIH